MRPRRSIATHAAAAIAWLLAGCSSPDEPRAANPGGAPAAGTSAASAGSSGPGGFGGASGSAAGVSAGGSAASSPSGSGGGGSTAGASGAGSTVPATFETIKLVLGGGGGIMPCAAAPCHGVNGVAPPARPLELPPNDDQQLYTNLTSYVSKACGDTKLVTPGNPAQSALVTILKGPCGMTPRMPYGCSPDAGDCIPDEYIDAVVRWIAGGAQRP